MSDGSRLVDSWSNALNNAESRFKQLLVTPSNEWKRVSSSNPSPTERKGKLRPSFSPELSDVRVHRRTVGGDDVYRLVLDVPAEEEMLTLESWRAVLTTPELRTEWDPAVSEAHLVEILSIGQATRISKTNFTLGWPASPRDAVTISRTMHDATTVIDISTSLPRSKDEPAYLRPSPPYVRSNVSLLAWCIQHLKPSETSTSKRKSGGKIRIICFWQHDLRAIWSNFAIGSSSSLGQQLSTMVLGLFKTTVKRATRIPKLVGYGNGISIANVRFQNDREALTAEYSVVPEEDTESQSHALAEGQDPRRLMRSIECILPAAEGWDVRLTTKASSEEVEKLPWTAHAMRSSSYSLPHKSPPFASSSKDHILLRISHSPLIDDHSVLKVQIVIEISGPSGGLRVNGFPKKVEEDGEQTRPGPEDMMSIASISVPSIHEPSIHGSNATSIASASSSTVPVSAAPPLIRMPSATGAGIGVGTVIERSAGAQKTIFSRVKRNYIYFSSLLQEPEAKWKRTTESRGVTITQLDSIDPTLVVYRAEATFVGVGLWDLYSAVVSPGAKTFWDKQHEDAALLEDVNELTELWWLKNKGAWPVNGRDSVVLKTVYKSPTTIHVFSFSVSPSDDPTVSHLFPNIPPVDPNVIRTQVDLQGWSIEALSPNTTLLTLLEQSDMKGWTNKASIPAQMISSLAGIGEFCIKNGGPPVVTRLSGARKREVRYEYERGVFRVEYVPSARRRTVASNSSSATGTDSSSPTSMSTSSGEDKEDDPTLSASPIIECEIRCDMDTWAHSLDIVIDPPPQSISCLRRHRLSDEGGGLWMTITHDALFGGDEEERLQVIVRRGPGHSLGLGEREKEKGLVMVNGAKTAVDVEEMPEQELKSLVKRKRVKPPRIPLDQPPVMGAVRRRRQEWGSPGDESPVTGETLLNSSGGGGTSTSIPKVSSPLARFFTYAVDQATATTQQTIAAISPISVGVDGNVDSLLDSSKHPVQYVLDALNWTQNWHCSLSPQTGWVLISDDNKTPKESASGDKGGDNLKAVSDKSDTGGGVGGAGLVIHRKLISSVSPVVPVHRGTKIIQGFSAEELANVIMENECRKQWDERYVTEGEKVLQEFGSGVRTRFVVRKGGFPFRDRGFYLVDIVARVQGQQGISRRSTGSTTPGAEGADAGNKPGCRNAIYCVSTSFSPESAPASGFSPAKYNPYGLPIGRVHIDAWILETLDPYSKENYAVPSSRCTRLIAVDYAGSVPAALNSLINASIPRAILNVEKYVRSVSSLPITRLPPVGLVLAERKDDEQDLGVDVGTKFGWKLKKRENDKMLTLVQTRYNSIDRVYASLILVDYPGHRESVPSRTTTASVSPARQRDRSSSIHLQQQQVTPRASRVGLNALMETSSSSSSLESMDTPQSVSSSPPSSLLNVPLPASPTASSFSNSSISVSPSQRERARTMSTSGSNSRFLGRSSSALTLKGEVRHGTDLVVGEIVIDSKLYPEGYVVTLKSKTLASNSRRTRLHSRVAASDKTTATASGSTTSTPPRTPINLDSLFPARNSNDTTETSSLFNSNASSTSPPSTSSTSSPPSEFILPLQYTLHTIPLSSLHSSGMNTYSDASPTRHLLKLSLPTAQYQVSSVKDPLREPVRDSTSKEADGPGKVNANDFPEKPGWLNEMEEGKAVVWIEVRPIISKEKGAGSGKSGVKGRGKAIVVDGTGPPSKEEEKGGSGSGKESKVWNAEMNGWEVAVVGEKEALTMLGREELLDDRVWRMGVLSRAINEADALPEDFLTPVAVADSLLDPNVANTEDKDTQSSVDNGPGMDGSLNESTKSSTNRDNTTGGDEGVSETALESLDVSQPRVGHTPPSSGTVGGSIGLGLGGVFFNFLPSFPYPNPLARFTTNGTLLSVGTSTSGSTEETSSSGGKGKETSTTAGASGDDTLTVGAATTERPRPTGLYPVSTLIIIALIAFLIGSLFRSLLSPADFIYVVKDMQEAEEAQVVETQNGHGVGWREMRRLFEIKYVLGGWDFQVAAVRRH